jgi:hypothetical protein
MSKQALGAFFTKLQEDTTMQEKLIQFAAEQGFEFTADELTDADLEKLAGGLMPTRRGSGWFQKEP